MSTPLMWDIRFSAIGYELYGLYDYWAGFSDELKALEKRETLKSLRVLEKKGWINDEIERQNVYQEISHRYQNAFPRLLNYTFLTMLYSISEFAITEFARELKIKKDIELEFTDIRGSFFTQVKTYFNKVLHFPLPTDCPEWLSLQKLRILRNAIVHDHGYWEQIPKNDQKKIDSWIESGDGIKMYLSEIEFTRSFCENIYADVKKWLDSLETNVKIELGKTP